MMLVQRRAADIYPIGKEKKEALRSIKQKR
jgi:hypothetical protein